MIFNTIVAGSGGAAEEYTFTFRSATYTFQKGMTWEEWITSPYNTEHSAPLIIYGNGVYTNNRQYRMGYPSTTSNSYTYYVKNIDIVCNLGYFYRNMGGGAT